MAPQRFTKKRDPLKIGVSPLLSADPATLPPQRKGSREKWGGFMQYVRAVKPGLPPLGWRDVTPYFGGIPRALNAWRNIAESQGYLLAIQVVIEHGFRYRRVAVALAVHPSATLAVPSTKKEQT